MSYKCSRRRDKRLSFLGFGSYSHYLTSKLWKEIRKTHLKTNSLCLLCGNLATVVHHSNYAESTLLGQTIDGLHSLCKKCHCQIEFNNGKKLKLFEANMKLKQLLHLQNKTIRFQSWK